MPQPEHYDVLVLGSGEGGKYLAWHLARSGRRAAVVERHWIGGSCPNTNCLPSKNELMATVQTAILAGLPYTVLRDAILAHPTMAEGLGPLFSSVPARS